MDLTSPEQPQKRTILLTGGAKRLGKAMSLKLASLGYTLIVHYNHSFQEAALLLEEIGTLGGKGFHYQADLSDLAAVEKMIPELVDAHGPLWGMVHNAAHFEPDRIDTLQQEELHTHFSVNLYAPLILAQHFSRQFQAHYHAHAALGETGSIIHMLDYCVHRLPRGFLSYTLSKTALWTATKQLAVALAPHIRVNAIAPGFVLSHPRLSDQKFEMLAESNLFQKRITLAQVADMVAFLLQAPAITGQLFTLDNGRHLMPVEYC